MLINPREASQSSPVSCVSMTSWPSALTPRVMWLLTSPSLFFWGHSSSSLRPAALLSVVVHKLSDHRSFRLLFSSFFTWCWRSIYILTGNPFFISPLKFHLSEYTTELCAIMWNWFCVVSSGSSFQLVSGSLTNRPHLSVFTEPAPPPRGTTTSPVQNTEPLRPGGLLIEDGFFTWTAEPITVSSWALVLFTGRVRKLKLNVAFASSSSFILFQKTFEMWPLGIFTKHLLIHRLYGERYCF